MWEIKEIRKALDSEEWAMSDHDPDREERAIYVGNWCCIAPSGKYYMPWTTNQTDEDIENDTKFMEETETLLSEHDLYFFTGEGSATDCFIGESREREDDE